MRFLRAAAVAVSLVAAAASAGAQAAPSAKDLAARIQAHYARVKDFTADFTQTQSNALLPKGRTDRGTVRIKKPLRMRWVYVTSDKQETWSDGLKLYQYEPRDKYVTITSIPKTGDGSTALLFLAGRGDLTKDFVASLPGDQPAGEWRLVLKPLGGRQADFSTLTLEVARTSLEFRGMIIEDDQGGSISRFRFTNLKENRGLTDEEFVFKIPKGVDPEFR